MNAAELIIVGATLVIIVRLLTFRRRGQRVRRGISVAAWLIISASAWLIVRIVTAGHPYAWWFALAMVLLAIGLIRTGGNVAHLIRPLKRPFP